MEDLDLSELRTLIDFGMLVLLWLVQRIIYPSFLHCDPQSLMAWHRIYVHRAGFLIVPLMLVQLPLVLFTSLNEPTWNGLAASICLLLCWGLTFFVSVPLHNKIDSGDLSDATRTRLIATNWPRTILWTAVFALGLI